MAVSTPCAYTRRTMARERPTYQDPSEVTETALLPVYCQAKAKTSGKRCAQRAIPGGHVCRFHGGGAPQVKRKAAERLGRLRDLALDSLIVTMEAEGELLDPAVRLKMVTELTKQIELLEGRATSRTEEKGAQEAAEVMSRLQGQIDQLADRNAKRAATLKVINGEG